METATHVFNEQLKRFEPVSKKCNFCFTGTANSIADCYFVPVFKENDRTNIVVYRSVKYSKADIGIPRCNDCKAIHKAAGRKALVPSLITALAIFVFMVYNFLNFHAVVSVLLFFLSAIAGFGGYAYLQNVFTRKGGINTLKEAAQSDPLVQNLLINGWSLKQPSA